jgi:NAD(P)-dependent dehydrogenase (short-subunit alcohol dehydrogenase family)
MGNLQNKIAVVTGGNSGIGYATAKEFIAQGATVIITGRRKDAIEKAATEMGSLGIVANQANVSETERLVESVAAQFGKIDILFLNAGIGSFASIAETNEQQFDDVMDINFKGAFFTLSKFIPLLNDNASVIFLSSNTASMSGAGSSVYSASKAALNSLMRIAAVELAPRGIRVNAISPGPTKTDIMYKAGLDPAMVDRLYEAMLPRIPLRKIGSTEDVAKMVAHFAGDYSSFITGAEILMDGGMSL